MQIQINSNNSVTVNEKFIRWASDEIEKSLDRFASKVTRIEVHFADENGDKSGTMDKHCSIEARLQGLQPVATNHNGPSLDAALAGAMDKLEKVLSRTIDKIDHKKGRTPFGGEPFADMSQGDEVPDSET